MRPRRSAFSGGNTPQRSPPACRQAGTRIDLHAHARLRTRAYARAPSHARMHGTLVGRRQTRRRAGAVHLLSPKERWRRWTGQGSGQGQRCASRPAGQPARMRPPSPKTPLCELQWQLLHERRVRLQVQRAQEGRVLQCRHNAPSTAATYSGRCWCPSAIRSAPGAGVAASRACAMNSRMRSLSCEAVLANATACAKSKVQVGGLAESSQAVLC